MIFAKSQSELREMLEFLYHELDAFNFKMQSRRSKIMTPFNNLDVDSLTIRGLLYFFLKLPHRYLDKLVTPSANRYSIEVSNRIRAAWAKFAQHYKWLTNRQIPFI